MVGAEAGSERNSESGREAVRQVIDKRKRLDGWVVGVQDIERRQGSRRSGGLEDSKGMRNSGRKHQARKSAKQAWVVKQSLALRNIRHLTSNSLSLLS